MVRADRGSAPEVAARAHSRHREAGVRHPHRHADTLAREPPDRGTPHPPVAGRHVLGPRPYDEGALTSRDITPDPHDRQIGVLLDNSAATVMAPLFLPDTPPTPRSPVYMYSSDDYQKPSPFDPTIVAGFDDAAKTKWSASRRCRPRRPQRQVSPPST